MPDTVRYTDVTFESDLLVRDQFQAVEKSGSAGLSAVCWRNSPPIQRRFSLAIACSMPCPARARTHPTATSTSSSIDCAGSSGFSTRAEIHRDPVWRRLRVGGGARHASAACGRRLHRHRAAAGAGPHRRLPWACPRSGRRTAAPARWPRGQDQRVEIDETCPPAESFAGDKPHFAVELNFVTTRGGLDCAITLKTFATGHVVHVSRRRVLDGSSGGGHVDRDAIADLADCITSAVWDTLAYRASASQAPTDAPLAVRMHDAAIRLADAEHWMECREADAGPT